MRKKLFRSIEAEVSTLVQWVFMLIGGRELAVAEEGWEMPGEAPNGRSKKLRDRDESWRPGSHHRPSGTAT